MKKNLYFALLFVFSTSNIFSQDIDYSNQLITRYLYQEILSKNGKTDGFWKTKFLIEAMRNREKLTSQVYETLRIPHTRADADRPVYTTSNIYNSSYFRIHYTKTGVYKVNITDNNSNSVPDFVEKVGFYFDKVYLKDSTSNYSVAPGDGTFGGNSKLDIYIGGAINGVAAIESGTYGYVMPEDEIGNNPKTPLTERFAWTSWICVNNDYSWLENPTQAGIDSALAVTAAHEFMHVVQFAYNGEMSLWLMEMTAVWAEEFHFPGYDDNFQYIPNTIEVTDVSLNLTNIDDPNNNYSDYWYGTWIFAQYLTEHTNNDIIRLWYEKTLQIADLQALDNILKTSWNSDFETYYKNFLVAKMVFMSPSSWEPYAFKRADDYYNYIYDYSDFTFEKMISFTGIDQTFNSANQGNKTLMRISSDYFLISPDRNFTISLTPESNAQIGLMVIKSNYTNDLVSVSKPVLNSGKYEVNVNDYSIYEEIVAVVYRLDTAVKNTNSKSYILNVKSIATDITTKETQNVAIFPNPCSQVLTIVAENEWIDVDILDLSGKLVRKIGLSENKTIDVSNLKHGCYFVLFRDKFNTVKRLKFIKE